MFQEFPVPPGLLDRKVLPAHKDLLDHRDPPDPQELLEHKVPPAHKDLLDPKDLKAPKGRQENEDREDVRSSSIPEPVM